ncbi:MAG: alpha/beta hydrolase [Reichenbachiella sp.]
MLKIIKLYFQFMSALLPKIAGNQAFELFQIPQNKKIRNKELPFYDKYQPHVISTYLEEVKVYEIGPSEGKMIFMVHGWESNAASLSWIGEQLADLGFRIILFDLPGHGYSKLKKTNLKFCYDTLLNVINHFDPKEPFSVVAHSFGSLVSSFGLSKTNYEVDQIVFLTSPNHSTTIFQIFKKMIGLSNKSYAHLTKRAGQLLGEPLTNASTEKFGPMINYNQMTLIHDQKDKIINIKEAQEVIEKWDNATLIEIKETGHYRMLWNDHVAQLVLNIFENTKQNVVPQQREEMVV